MKSRKIKKAATFSLIFFPLLFVLELVCLFTMGGCVILPFPHTQRHADEVHGKIIDENGNPVPNVMVASPAKKMTGVNVGKREAVTDADGCFTLKSVHGWHWGYFIPFFVTGTGNVSIWPYFDPYLEGIGQGGELHFIAEGFPKQKFTPSHWRSRINTWKPPVNNRESEFFIYGSAFINGNWETIGNEDKKPKVFMKNNTIVASEIMLHRQATSNYLAAVTHARKTNTLDVTSILLCEMYKNNPKDLTVKCVITDTNLIATIVSELSAPAEITTLAVPQTKDDALDEILCCMVLYASSKPMRVGHVVKHDGTILNSRVDWWGGSKGTIEFSQHTADITWSFRSEAIANLVREVLAEKEGRR